MDVADFVSEFREDPAAVAKKYERRRVLLHGEICGKANAPRPSVNIGQAKVGHQVSLRLDSRPSFNLDDFVTVEGDFQLVDEHGAPALANCTIEKVPRPQ